MLFGHVFSSNIRSPVLIHFSEYSIGTLFVVVAVFFIFERVSLLLLLDLPFN